MFVDRVAVLPRYLSSLAQVGPVRAFPTAEGFGASAIGGRGGRVIEVTNLNDNGPGSFRAAVTASGPRTVVFRIGGTISLLNPLEISSGFLTIAGQTAPGGGIALRTRSVISVGGEASVSDIIVRYLRFRYDMTHGPTNQDVVTFNGTRNIFDHCSFSWGTDATFSAGKANHSTVQWCIISEGLTKGSEFSEGSHRLSIHHNLWAHHFERLPKIRGENALLGGNAAIFDFVNNVVYNWANYATGLAGSAQANAVNNYYKAGANSPSPGKVAEIVRMQGEPGRSLYVVGNFGPSCSGLDCSNQWASIISDVGGVRGDNTRTDSRHAAPQVVTTSAAQAFTEVLARAGASFPMRDAVDQRIVSDVKNGSGRILGDGTGIVKPGQDPGVVFGWPVLAPGAAPADSDHDGMPDSWEVARGLNPNDPNDGPKVSANGYTNLENYLNGLVDSALPPLPPVVLGPPVPAPPPAPGPPVVVQPPVQQQQPSAGPAPGQGGNGKMIFMVLGGALVVWVLSD